MQVRFKRLRMLLCGEQINQGELAQVIGRSGTYFSLRMVGRAPFDMQDVYAICDYLKIPYEEIQLYFPKDGIEQKKAG